MATFLKTPLQTRVLFINVTLLVLVYRPSLDRGLKTNQNIKINFIKFSFQSLVFFVCYTNPKLSNWPDELYYFHHYPDDEQRQRSS